MNTEHEHEYFLDNESTVYACECGALSIGDKIYYPAEELKQRDETIKQLKEALKEILMYCEEDGRPVDGFQLRDNILTAKRLTQ